MVEDLLTQAIQTYIALDIDDDPEFMHILELASDVCGVPFAFITLLDDKNQYLKAGKGFKSGSVPLDQSFCRYTVEQDDVMIVQNALVDNRFAKYNAVTSDFGLRFYAGAPLTSFTGAKLGALCVVGTQPSTLNAQQIATLKILSEHVVFIMERKAGIGMLHEKQKQLDKQKKFIDVATIRLRSFFESSTNFHVLLGKNGEIIDFNKTASDFIRDLHGSQLVRGNMLIPYLEPSFVATFIDRYHKCLTGLNIQEEGSTDYGEHGIIWWLASFEPARDANEEIIGVSYIIRNITDSKARELKIVSQNESLLTIAHIQAHEFRAPLTTIMGIMNLIIEEQQECNIPYFELLGQAVDNLDVKITSIVNDIENNMDIAL